MMHAIPPQEADVLKAGHRPSMHTFTQTLQLQNAVLPAQEAN